jgi:AcrR family transcriptional regulator
LHRGESQFIFCQTRFAMPYRKTDKVTRKLAARHAAILAAAREALAAGGMGAVQIAAVAERAGIATGTVYRYFPAKTDLVAKLVQVLALEEVAALGSAARAAPGPLSALAATFLTFSARVLVRRRIATALLTEAVEVDVAAARAPYRAAVGAEFERLIAAALAGNHLPEQDAKLTATAVLGALIAGLIGPGALPVTQEDGGRTRVQVQALALLGLRALGVADARARGLVVQTVLPDVGHLPQ